MTMGSIAFLLLNFSPIATKMNPSNNCYLYTIAFIQESLKLFKSVHILFPFFTATAEGKYPIQNEQDSKMESS